MPSVFLSYAGEQEGLAREFENRLIAQGIKVWRDKTSLHAGARWPKALGDAIATSGTLLLLWSAQAEKSDFVELEWNIAVGMHKPVIPCLLDGTALPPTLKPSHSIPGQDILRAAELIRATLMDLTIPAPAEQQYELLTTLETVAAVEPKQVLKQINTIINQLNWGIQGNLYQGGIHISTISAESEKSHVERVAVWVAVFVGALTILGMVLDFPSKWHNFLNMNENTVEERNVTAPSTRVPVSQTYKMPGTVKDDETGNFLSGVHISVPEINDSKFDCSSTQGSFELLLTLDQWQMVEVVAKREGYKDYIAEESPLSERIEINLVPEEKNGIVSDSDPSDCD